VLTSEVLRSFGDEFEKIAVNIRGLRSIHKKVIAPKLIRKRTLAVDVNAKKVNVTKGATGIISIIPTKGLPKKVVDNVPGNILPYQNKILTGKGGAYKGIKAGTGNIVKFPKAKPQQEAVGRVTLMHEQFETLQRGKKFKQFLGHGSPNVILSESNLVRSLPKRYNPTKRAFTKLRGEDLSSIFIRDAYPGFEYGKTKLSRAAKKHIIRKLTKPMKPAY